MKDLYMINSEVLVRAPITFTTNETSVNKFDAIENASVIASQYIQLPSVKQEASKLKPSVLNEKEKEIASIVSAVNQLASEHETYIEQYVTRGNLALYAVLAKIYALVIQINLSDNSESILKSLRNKLALQKNIKTQKNTSAMTLIVRWVVGGSRQLAHTYSKALEFAYEKNIAVSDIAEHFSTQGGLSGSKKQLKKYEQSKQDEALIHFKSFITNADVNHASYKDTKIIWTEDVYGAVTSDYSIVIASNNGGGHFSGLRAFNLSNSAYEKIVKILSDEQFKDKTVEDVESWVESERQVAIAKKRIQQTII